MDMPFYTRSKYLKIIFNLSTKTKQPILQCGRFLRARECFARESATLKLEKGGENGASQKERSREGKREEIRVRVRLLSPPPFLLLP